MAKSFFELEQNIQVKINDGDELVLQASRMNQKVEKYILHTITRILEKLDSPQLVEMIYTITKELSINGMKANQKRIFFEDQDLDINDPGQYDAGVERFKKEFSEEMNEKYGKRAIEMGIYVKILFMYNADGLCIEVINNTPIAPEEERRMREKMKKSMGYNDIAEFYMDNMDNTEGAGLGIALIMILMKGQDLDPNLFRIMTLDDKTIARVEIPLTENYVSKRSKQLERLN
ncbi:MAG: histidine kinase [Leptospiraceae bacterium]|nr:histidine kinase [Leptospiraceae bacterium]